MRTIKELYTINGKVYLWIGNTGAYNHFVQAAKEEGFRLLEGEDDIFSLNADWSFSHPGFVGHMAFHNTNRVSGKELIRVDYTKWISGAGDYLYYGDDK